MIINVIKMRMAPHLFTSALKNIRNAWLETNIDKDIDLKYKIPKLCWTHGWTNWLNDFF